MICFSVQDFIISLKTLKWHIDKNQRSKRNHLASHLQNYFLPPVNYIPPFLVYGNMHKFQQLLHAFQSGMELNQQRSNNINSIHTPEEEQQHYIVNDTIKGKQTNERRPKLHEDVVSQWDPWFHRRIRKNVKKQGKLVKMSARKIKVRSAKEKKFGRT